MNQTGTYVYVPGQGCVQVSDAVPHLASHVWTPKGDRPYYDKSLRMRIESKAHKRHVLKEAGMKEGGLIRNPDKRWDGPTKNSAKLSWKKKREAIRRQDWIRSHGGVDGVLNRLATQKESHV